MADGVSAPRVLPFQGSPGTVPIVCAMARWEYHDTFCRSSLAGNRPAFAANGHRSSSPSWRIAARASLSRAEECIR